MTKSEIERRKQYLPKGGCRFLEDLLTNRNGGKTVIKQRGIAAILRKERKDNHGVLELFKEVTDLEKKKREKAAKEIAKQLAA
jgi:hypothetical protein